MTDYVPLVSFGMSPNKKLLMQWVFPLGTTKNMKVVKLNPTLWD